MKIRRFRKLTLSFGFILSLQINASENEVAPGCEKLFADLLKISQIDLNAIENRTAKHGTGGERFFDPRMPKAVEGMSSTNLAFMPSTIKQMTIEEISMMADDMGVARSISAQYKKLNDTDGKWFGPEFFNLYAKAIKIRASMQVEHNGEALKWSNLVRQAQLAKYEVRTGATVFRYDSRSPEEILSAEGFAPNPKKQQESLVEHSLPKNAGGGSFVSTTFREDNSFVVINPSFDKKYINLRSSKEKEDFLSRQPGITEEARKLDFGYDGANIFQTYEYRIVDLDGVVVPPIEGVAAETEFVATKVPLAKISAFRLVTLRYKDQYNPAIYFYGPWQSMP